ncbi:MAG TPA: hypothetical protein ENK51_08135 [Gammaproteobacteria bacterium]|nr:hypothetical protein [Gammaproteobacteria bacterium]
MTDKDATRQKLVNSMRKTKAGVAGQAAAPVKTEADAPVKAPRPKKPAASRAKPKKPSPVKGKSAQPDSFSSGGGRRVWPD